MVGSPNAGAFYHRFPGVDPLTEGDADQRFSPRLCQRGTRDSVVIEKKREQTPMDVAEGIRQLKATSEVKRSRRV
jgi:hypothetical protein